MAAFGVPAAGAVCRCASLWAAVGRCGPAVPRGPRGALWRTNLMLFDTFAALSYSKSHK